MMRRSSRALPFALAHAGQLSAEALRRFSELRENTVATSESVKNQNFWRVLKGCGTRHSRTQTKERRKQMPLINVKAMEGAFTSKQKQEIVN